MNEELDILSVDKKIRKEFEIEAENLQYYKIREKRIENSMKVPNLRLRVMNDLQRNLEKLRDKIRDIEDSTSENYYLLNSADLIRQYRTILKAPKKVSFMGKRAKEDKETERKKRELIKRYIEVAKSYVGEETLSKVLAQTMRVKKKRVKGIKGGKGGKGGKSGEDGGGKGDKSGKGGNTISSVSVLSFYGEDGDKNKGDERRDRREKECVKCDGCGSKEFEVGDDNINICIECSAQKAVLKNVTSYRDSDRVNSSSKYAYDRKTHFKDCYKCYQGKQNCTIPQVLYDDLEEQFELHYLLIGDKSTPKKERFKKITKEHIKMFLKELGYIKHYENVNLIHYNMTGKKPDDIGHLENRLDEDFDKLLNLYDLRYAHLDRSNFLKNQYILFQLLMRYKHPCKKEDFSNMLRTIDRKVFHDEICKALFEELGWNHTPFF